MLFKDAPLRRSDRRRRWLRPVAVSAAAVLALSCSGLDRASAEPDPADEAQAAASVIDVSTLQQALAGAGSTAASTSNPGPDQDALNAGVLGDKTIDLGGGVSVPVSELVDFGKGGAIGSASEVSSPGDAHAVSGLVAEGGSVTLSGDDASFAPATVDLLKLADKAGENAITNAAIDQLELQLGAFGSEVTAENGTISDPDGVGGAGQYRIGQADLLVQSPAIKDAANGIYGAVGSVDDEVESIVSDKLDPGSVTGLLGAVPGVPEPKITVESDMQDEIFADLLAKPITSTNKLITIDFSTGQLQVHLDQLAHNGINNMDPNSELLTSKTYPLIAETVHDMMRDITNRIVGSVDGALGSVTVNLQFTKTFGPDDVLDVTWPVNLRQAVNGDFPAAVDNSSGPTGGTLGNSLTTVINTLGVTAAPIFKPVYDFILSDDGDHIFDLAINDIKLGITTSIVNAIKPAFDALNGFVSVQANHQQAITCTPGTGSEPALAGVGISAISLGLAGDTGRLNFGNSGVRVSPDVCASTGVTGDDADSEQPTGTGNADVNVGGTVTTVQGQPVTFGVNVDSDADIDPATIGLVGPDGKKVTELSTDQGSWTVDTEHGTVTFEPAGDLTGTVEPVKIVVEDVDGNVSTANATVQVSGEATDQQQSADSQVSVDGSSDGLLGSLLGTVSGLI
ncbi:choice-of-anchor G family protein [Microlunatus soli]|uniref:CshA-type fibril repeat-containing protein n=1 Tax=Microlunatus soli TaxID=630515 RepID=A0A1H1V238_9ACTN|nr:choice-of-anchor G family protein [Microlunatus soli]SDS78581.1 CshA-type fibril repeat-containing protein [Microlunatus soli]